MVRFGGKLVLCALVSLSLAACSSSSSSGGGTAAPGDKGVGYVRMEDLVKHHPLYGQLSDYDHSIAALNMRSIGSDVALTGAQIAKEQSELQRELKAAAERTNTLLKEKQDEYAKRETAAIEAALAGSGASGPGAAQLAAGLNATAQSQQNAALGAARTDFGKYRDAVISQDKSATGALVKTYNDRANRLYRQKADQFTTQESQYALKLAQDDSGERLTLRTRLSNLALDDSGRDDSKKALDALDRKESDEIAAMRNRDQQQLEAYKDQLRKQMRDDLDKQIGSLHQQTSSKLQAAGAVPAGAQPVAVNAGNGPGGKEMPAQLRSKLESLHKEYQNQFNQDAQQTITDFNKTKDDLQKRFDQLIGADATAQGGAQKQLAALQKQRDDLYDQIVAQIQREVQIVAKNRGVTVVFSNIVAPVSGVDLTTDAEKQVESLHE
jgi:hypothetical protein